MFSSLSDSSAMHPTRYSILSFLFLQHDGTVQSALTAAASRFTSSRRGLQDANKQKGVSPCFCCHDFGSVLLRGITIAGQDLEPAVGGKHPQIHKHLSGKERTPVNGLDGFSPEQDGSGWFPHVLLEKLFLSFRLVEKQISGPVCRRQSPEGFLQVVMFLEALDELLQLFLSSLNWTKPGEQQQKRKRVEIQLR